MKIVIETEMPNPKYGEDKWSAIATVKIGKSTQNDLTRIAYAKSESQAIRKVMNVVVARLVGDL